MKKVFLTALIALVAVMPAHAQSTTSDSPSRFELGMNPVSILRQGGQNVWGGNISLAMRRSEHLSYVADLTFHQTRPPAPIPDALQHPDPFTTSAYRFGLRYYAPARGKFRPFGQVLAGGANLGAVTTTTLTPTPTGNTTAKTTILDRSHSGFAFATGGGLDRAFKSWFSWRVLQVDYSLIHAGRNLNGVRIHTGAVFHFGHSE